MELLIGKVPLKETNRSVSMQWSDSNPESAPTSSAYMTMLFSDGTSVSSVILLSQGNSPKNVVWMLKNVVRSLQSL